MRKTTSILAALCALLLAAPAVGQAVAPATTPGTVECTTGPTFNLRTAAGRIQTPDGNSVYMWGYANEGGRFQIPGPVLCVNEGDTVTINLTNNLSEPTSLVFPGQSGVTASGGSAGLLAREAAASGGTVSYSFTADRPGTYLYESGTEPSKQVEMGLYGAIIVRPAMGANFAYNDAETEFDPAREYLILLHDIDPDLHHAVDRGQPFDITTKHDRYWTINGRAFPDSIADSGVPWLPNQPYGSLVWVEIDSELPALIRYANAGLSNHPFHPHGNHLSVIARDGALLKEGAANAASEAFAKTIGSGQSYDLLFRFEDDESYSGSSPVTFEGSEVVFPGLLNLVFADDLTFYSGSPYLGEQDELPAAVTQLNECGEFFYPWHSHALNEFQNFDEGFGGLATLLRVDPIDGCPPADQPAVNTAPPAVSGPAAPGPGTSRARPVVSAKGTLRGRTLTVRAHTKRCAPCAVKAKVKAGAKWRTLKMSKIGRQYVANARRLPKGTVSFYAVARDRDSRRTARSALRQLRMGPAALVTLNLCADEGTTALTSTTSVPIWGFSNCVGAPSLPGPQLEVTAGDLVTVNLTNNLDSENVSLVFPGQTLAPDVVGVAPGGSTSYTFLAANPGIYLYESGVNTQTQLPMGLYGALVVRPGLGAGFLYDDLSTAYDQEHVMVLSEVDTDLNASPGAFDPLDWSPDYWLINGTAYPDTPAISAAPGTSLALRYVNAGQNHHTMTLVGMRQRIMARDSFQPPVRPDIVAETISEGATADAIAVVPSTPGANIPLYSRQLAVTNGPVFPGGMLRFISVPAP